MAVEREGRDALLGEPKAWILRDWTAGYVEVIVETRRWLELVVMGASEDVAAEAAALLCRLEPVAPSSRAVIARRFPGAA